jgi:hypothetical protein
LSRSIPAAALCAELLLVSETGTTALHSGKHPFSIIGFDLSPSTGREIKYYVSVAGRTGQPY